MVSSFVLLVAACAAGDCGCGQGGSSNHPGVAAPVGYFGPRIPMFPRLHNIFVREYGFNRARYAAYDGFEQGGPAPVMDQMGHPAPAMMMQQPMPQPMPQTSQIEAQEPPLAAAAPAAPQQAVHAVPAGQNTTVVVRRPDLQSQPANVPAIAKKYEDRVGHEDDYSWVTGHLFYVHTDGGRWVVRYGLPEVVDRYGGSVVLAPGVDMRNYREGDLVCVYGQVLEAGRTSAGLGGALYRVNSIGLVDRADQ